MIMDFDGFYEKCWERDVNDDSNRLFFVEGFEGNFVVFDFGEIVCRVSISMFIVFDDK